MSIGRPLKRLHNVMLKALVSMLIHVNIAKMSQRKLEVLHWWLVLLITALTMLSTPGTWYLLWKWKPFQVFGWLIDFWSSELLIQKIPLFFAIAPVRQQTLIFEMQWGSTLTVYQKKEERAWLERRSVQNHTSWTMCMFQNIENYKRPQHFLGSWL